MPTPLETEINALLRAKKDPTPVAEELIRRWRHNLLSEDEQFDCAQFMLAAGLYSLLFTEVLRLIEEGAKLPWAQFAEAIGRSGVKPDGFDVRALFDAAASQDAIGELLLSRQLDLFSREFAARRTELKDHKLQELGDRKQALKDKIQFMRSQRMFEQESLLLDEMQAVFPAEGVESEKQELRLRWAREVVAGARATENVSAKLDWKLDQLTPEEEKARAMITARAKEIAEKNPRLAYDLAIGLQTMGFHNEAIAVLELAKPAPAVDWLRLELLISARKFVSALDETTRLEAAYANDPESMFASTYARARALHGLGEQAAAIEILEGLVRIRPNYKSAQSLLLDWTGGES